MQITRRHLHKSNPKPLKRKPVTLIVGIICKDGAVIAADSQTSWGSKKSWAARKMSRVDRGPDSYCLVAESGAVLTSAKIVEALHVIELPEGDVSNGAGVARTGREDRARLRSHHFDCTSEELQQIIQNNELDCGLMVAHFAPCGAGPTIDTIDLLNATPQLVFK